MQLLSPVRQDEMIMYRGKKKKDLDPEHVSHVLNLCVILPFVFCFVCLKK